VARVQSAILGGTSLAPGARLAWRRFRERTEVAGCPGAPRQPASPDDAGGWLGSNHRVLSQL